MQLLFIGYNYWSIENTKSIERCRSFYTSHACCYLLFNKHQRFTPLRESQIISLYSEIYGARLTTITSRRDASIRSFVSVTKRDCFRIK